MGLFVLLMRLPRFSLCSSLQGCQRIRDVREFEIWSGKLGKKALNFVFIDLHLPMSHGWLVNYFHGCLLVMFFLKRRNYCGRNSFGRNYCGIKDCEFWLNLQSFLLKFPEKRTQIPKKIWKYFESLHNICLGFVELSDIKYRRAHFLLIRNFKFRNSNTGFPIRNL